MRIGNPRTTGKQASKASLTTTFLSASYLRGFLVTGHTQTEITFSMFALLCAAFFTIIFIAQRFLEKRRSHHITGGELQ